VHTRCISLQYSLHVLSEMGSCMPWDGGPRGMQPASPSCGDHSPQPGPSISSAHWDGASSPGLPPTALQSWAGWRGAGMSFHGPSASGSVTDGCWGLFSGWTHGVTGGTAQCPGASPAVVSTQTQDQSACLGSSFPSHLRTRVAIRSSLCSTNLSDAG